MNLIALESSGRIASVALWEDGRVLAEEYFDIGLTHSQILLPLLEDAMQRAGRSVHDFDAICCDVGPGSFTGLRIGCATTNAIAFAGNLSRIAVNSLEVLATGLCVSESDWIAPLIDARQERIYAALYQTDADGHLREKIAPCAAQMNEWIEKLPAKGRIVFLGDGALVQKDMIAQQLGKRAFFPDAHMMLPRAGALAACAARKEGDYVRRIDPLYLRLSQAEQERQGHVH